MYMENSFYNVLQYSLNSKFSSRPPKMELTGLLLRDDNGFKLETDSKEYRLSVSGEIGSIAKKLIWEEVTVRGYLDLETNVFEVERIKRSKLSDSNKSVGFWADPYFEIEGYQRAIQQSGKLEPAFEEWVS